MVPLVPKIYNAEEVVFRVFVLFLPIIKRVKCQVVVQMTCFVQMRQSLVFSLPELKYVFLRTLRAQHPPQATVHHSVRGGERAYAFLLGLILPLSSLFMVANTFLQKLQEMHATQPTQSVVRDWGV